MSTRGTGALTIIVGLYTVLALAAGGRASVQLADDPGHAPFAYGLTAVAAVVYVAGAVLLRRSSERARVAAKWVCIGEFAGVLVVGTLSLIERDWFPESSVWSIYGAGYGFVPLFLPPAALWWLGRVSHERPSAAGGGK
ncbi:hypothetical protein GCM10009547_01150 [Sporichthya brevicatena]|uniref:Integral membrane protein n=1 Tax=Sporichthya brevicatena TaxID=171442 RepID=A0ABN1G3T4_9ACTN